MAKKHARASKHRNTAASHTPPSQSATPKQPKKNKKPQSPKSNSFACLDDNTRELASQLAELGLRIKDMTGDGNCLFRALSDQLYGSPTQHSSCRSDACDHMQQNPDLYAPFLDEEDGGVDGYVSRMRKPGIYGGNMELVAFARKHTVDIAVHQAGQPIWIVSGSTDPDQCNNEQQSASKRHTLHIVYHSWEHYSSVRNADGPESGLPEIVIKPSTAKENGNHPNESHKSKKTWERDPDEPPTQLETMVMSTTGVQDLAKVRVLFSKFRGDPNKVMDVLYEQMDVNGECDHEKRVEMQPSETDPAQDHAVEAVANGSIDTADLLAEDAEPCDRDASESNQDAIAVVEASNNEPDHAAATSTTLNSKPNSHFTAAQQESNNQSQKRLTARQRKEQSRKSRKQNSLEKKRIKATGGESQTSNNSVSTTESNASTSKIRSGNEDAAAGALVDGIRLLHI